MNISEFSLRRPVTVVVVMLVFITIGIISLTKLPLEMMPEISFPGLMVQVTYSSSSPEEVERSITRPLEEILATVNNVKNIRSTSSSGSSRIFMEFNDGTDMDITSMEIRDKIDQVRGRLPDDLERIRIRRWSTSDRPVIRFNLSIPGNRDQANYLAENLITPELERIEGVANVDIRGLRNKQLTIKIKSDVFYSSQISILDLVDTITNNNINISAGYVEDDNKRYVLRVMGELKMAEQILSLPLNRQGLKIKDVADVKYDYPKKENYNWLNGKDSMGFRIYRASNANVVKVCNKVKEAVANLKERESSLKGMEVRFYRDQSNDITSSIKSLAISGIIGGLLAVIVLLFFLRKFRSTIIITIAIPMAIVFTFCFMYLFQELVGTKVSINIISLSGLMMAVGMLVDNSVVVLENIFRLRQEQGLSPGKAALKGSSEVSMAVTASTLTTLVVFVSISFVSQSFFGKMMRDFALTISLALIASLLVSLTFIPLASSKLLKGKTKEKAKWLKKLTGIYEGIIVFSLKNYKTKILIVVLAVVIFISAFVMFGNLEEEFMPSSKEREVEMTIMMPRSFSMEEMLALYREFHEIIMNNKKEFALDNYTAYFGVERIRQGRYRGSLDINMTEEGPSVSEVKDRIKKLFPQKPGVQYEFSRARHRGGFMSGISVELIGKDYTVLTELVPVVVNKLKDIEQVEDISTDLEGGDTQLLVKVDRKKAESAGVDSRRVARTIMASISERPIGKFKTDNKEIDIILNIEKEDGFSQEDLKNLNLRARSKRIPISAISNFTYRIGSTAIQKENKNSKLRINLNIKRKGIREVSEAVQDRMAQIQLPEGYSWSFGRSWRRFRDSQESSMTSIFLALIFIYIIMASLFESFVHPFTILFTVPLAIFGVALSFTILGLTKNNTSFLGLLTLFGIVVNNGIILIDHINHLRNKRGMEKSAAIIQAGKDRMRPIIMTAITTIFGVLPMALPVIFPELFPSVSRRAQMWAPISIAILGGLTTSTFFTLIFLPTFYSIFDSFTTGVKNFFGFKPRVIE